MESIVPRRPVRPLAPYIGGKRNLAKTIVALIERTPHTLYAEGFVGMAGVFLRRTCLPKAEVINDASRDVATFFRVLQRHYLAFVEMMRFQLTRRAEFERLTRTDPETLTDLERAARFFYLQRTAFGGKVAGRTFGVSTERPARFDITRLAPMIEDVHERLAGVTIECLDFREFLARYDRAGTLFYLDPPYWGSTATFVQAPRFRKLYVSFPEALCVVSGSFMCRFRKFYVSRYNDVLCVALHSPRYKLSPM